MHSIGNIPLTAARRLLAALFAAMPGAAPAEPLPDMAPVPYARPDTAGGAQAALERAMRAVAVHPDRPGAVVGDDAAATRLNAALAALARGDMAAVEAVRATMPATGPETGLERRVLAWATALSDSETLSRDAIARAARDFADWPGAAALRRRLERAFFRDEPAPGAVIAALGGAPPETYEGVAVLARAHLARGETAAARAVLSPFWRRHKLDARRENAFLAEFGALLPAADHRHRMERMLYEDRIGAAERVAERAGGAALVRAWAAVIRGHDDAEALLEAVPEEQRTAGYYFARARHLRRAGEFRAAAALLAKAPDDAAALIDPDAWWNERRILSRELLDIGAPRAAYRVAAAQVGGSPAGRADAAFHAGWYALRALDEAETAAKHFARIAEIAAGPISGARAHYWLGRAAEAGGPGTASDHYARAARHGTAFYGQLAAARLGRETLALDDPSPDAAARRRFTAREKVRALDLLERAGHFARAAGFYRALADELSDPDELALLARRAEARGEHRLALRVAKTAARRGIAIGALAHPLGAIPTDAAIPAARRALAYAVARQETEFDAGAVSSAGARGLLQLLPGTARDMARKSGLAYSRARLTADPAYNATLGAAYLDEQLERFAGSYILTLAGYNAGPRRAAEWIARYGDPRGAELETVIDWIERIPYPETRNYVMRVMENLQVYKMRLSGRFDIAGDLRAGG